MESKTNKIQKLLQSLCPNGVEYKTLGEVCERIFAGGTPKTNNSRFYNGDIPWLRSGEINFNKIYKTEKTITQLGFEKSSARWIKEKSCLLAMTGATVGRCAVNEIAITANQSVCAMEVNKNLDYRFLYYYLANNYIKIKNSGQGVLTSLNISNIKQIKIPIPPLEVQQEIVRILDKFTELEKELEKELEARRKQYAYYRENLLSLEYLESKDSGVRLVSLGELGTFIRGNGLQKSDFVDSGIPCIHYGEIHTYYKTFAHHTKSFVSAKTAEKLKKAQYGNLVIAGVSENKEDACKAVVYLGKDDVCISGDSFAFSHSQNPKFIGYMLQTQAFSEYKQKYTYGTKVMRMHIDKLKQFKIPIPPLEVQQEIVRILDKFEDLTQNLQQGLPAEIQARKKQYEYYREMLLSF